MNEDIKEKINEKFNMSKLSDEEKERKLSDINEKYEKIILPTIKEFIDLFIKNGMTIVEQTESHYVLQRNETKFLFQWELQGEVINFQYQFVGAGLVPSPSLQKNQITEEAIISILTKFSDYILKES